MKLTLSDIEKDPSILTYEIPLTKNKIYILRPLEKNDVEIIARFLKNLSEKTRKNYTLESYDKNILKNFVMQ